MIWCYVLPHGYSRFIFCTGLNSVAVVARLGVLDICDYSKEITRHEGAVGLEQSHRYYLHADYMTLSEQSQKLSIA